MKFLFRWTFRLFILTFVLLVGVVLLKDTLIKSLAETQIRCETGMDVKIGKLEVGLLSPTITIENFKLYNTPEFGGSPFLDIPEFHLQYDRSQLASRKLRLNLLRFNLAQINVVENKRGEFNFEMPRVKKIWIALGSTNRADHPPFAFAGIDTVNLSLGSLRYLNLKKPGQIKEFQINVKNQIATDIQSPDDLTARVLTILLRNGVAIKLLGNH